MKFVIPKKLHNWNDIIGHNRANRFYANKQKQEEMEEISEHMNIEPVKNYPIKMVFKWHIKSKISDLDNKSVKSILDELQRLKVIKNDNIKYINEITYIAIPDKEDYVEVEIKESES